MAHCGRGCQSQLCWFQMASSPSYGVTIPLHVVGGSEGGRERETLKGSPSGNGKVGRLWPCQQRRPRICSPLRMRDGSLFAKPRPVGPVDGTLPASCPRALLQGPNNSRSSLGSIQFPSAGGPRLPFVFANFCEQVLLPECAQKSISQRQSEQRAGAREGGGLCGTSEECSGLRSEVGTPP